MRFTCIVIFYLFVFITSIQSRIIHIGNGYALTTPAQLQGNLKAGDTALIHAGNYTGTFFLNEIAGTVTAPIVIRSAPGEIVLFSGGTESFHLSDVSYLVISDLIIEKQTGNGMNIDDAGTFATPSHHLTIQNCIFRNINATGNNDLLKLSGVDDFVIKDCIIQNGASGGSGIDMVGCHRGLFIRNQFSNLGSNSIQIKGGSEQITITQNKFVNGGARALNIGGSTGLEFFRPLNASFEASRVTVYANIIEGSEAPFAFVGSVNSIVYNNTIIRPGKWAMRILQETVDANRFQLSGKDSVINNIFIITNNVSTEVNIGPNTAPTTFFFSNNLWYKEGQSGWAGPVLPVSDQKQIVGNPALNATNYKISLQSIAYQKGKVINNNSKDYYNNTYSTPPSVGAVEVENTTAINTTTESQFIFYPNPADGILNIVSNKTTKYSITDLLGKIWRQGMLQEGGNKINIEELANGIYWLIDVSPGTKAKKFAILK